MLSYGYERATADKKLLNAEEDNSEDNVLSLCYSLTYY